MMSSENDDFKLLKTAKKTKHKKPVHHVHLTSGVRETVLSLQISLSLTRNMKVKVAIELYYFFPKYRNLDTSNYFTGAEYTCLY